MPSSYTITEPHPTVPQNSYTHSGRGGAGNFFRAPRTTSPSGVPTPAIPSTTASSSTSSSSTRRFYSGRGGAGNAHAASDRAVISFDEEYTRAENREQSAMYSHVGRGGAGNIFSSLKKSSSGSGDGDSLARTETSSTGGSQKSGFWSRVMSHAH